MNRFIKFARSSKFRPVALAAGLLLLSFLTSSAQQPQLTLADLLIGLRSKKVTIEERNSILAEAVRQRGITFTLTPEIEKELVTTGASKVLVDAVKERSAASAPAPTPTPAPTPPPPDFNYYKTRADGSFNKGEYSLALADYDKAVALRTDSPIAFLSRGRTYYNLKEYEKAGADFDKSIELDPKDSRAYYNRGILFESKGELEKAQADYQKAADLDASNEAAKAMLKKVTDLLAVKAAEKAPPTAVVEPPPVTTPVKAPESMNLGSLTMANAIRMVKPSYAPIAQRSNIEGRVVVEVELDEKGNVVSAKAVSGHQLLRGSAEDAARKSKFKPAMFGDQAVKATGTITYSFSLKATNE